MDHRILRVVCSLAAWWCRAECSSVCAGSSLSGEQTGAASLVGTAKKPSSSVADDAGETLCWVRNGTGDGGGVNMVREVRALDQATRVRKGKWEDGQGAWPGLNKKKSVPMML